MFFNNLDKLLAQLWIGRVGFLGKGRQSQKKNVRKQIPLYFEPSRKRLIAREEGNRAPWLEDALKSPLFLRFPSSGVAHLDSNHMPLVRYISQFTVGYIMLFHQNIAPSCANARENDPRRDIARQEAFIGAPERNTVRVLHGNSYLSDEVNIKVQGTRRFLSERS